MPDPMTGDTHLVPSSLPPGQLMPQGPTLHVGSTLTRPSQGAMAWTLIKALYRRWQQALVFGLLAALAVGAAVWFLLPPPMPGAVAKLYVPMNPRGGIGEHPDPPMERGTHVAWVKSELVLNAALRPPEIHDLPILKEQKEKGLEPLDWLKRNLVVDFSDGPEILRISLSSEDPNQARLIVEAVKDSYLKEVINQSDVQRRVRIAQLNEMSTKAKASLDRQRTTLNNLASKTGGATDPKGIEFQAELIRDGIKQARIELGRTKSDITRVKAEEAAFKTGRSGTIELPEEVLKNYVANDSKVKESLENQAKIEEYMKQVRETAVDPEKNDSYIRAKTDLDKQKKQHEKLLIEVAASVKDRLKSKSSVESAQHLLSLKDQLAFYQSYEKVLTDEINNQGAILKNLQLGNLDIQPQILEIKLAEELYSNCKKSLSLLEMELDTPARVREMEKATITRVDAEKRKHFFVGIGALAALAGVGAMIGLKELRMRRVDSAESIAQGLGLPIVGMIPKHPSRLARASGIGDGGSWQAGMIESINCTRTMLLHGSGLSSIKVIQITSPVSGEGKTTLSTHLALSVALAGRKTLLIDGDLRNPNAHRPFNLPDNPGLCELLRGETTLAEAIQATTVAGLTVLPAGRWADGTQLALASTGLEGIFAQVRSEFEFVVVDSSPVLPLTDPLLLARHVDGVIVSLLQGVSRLPLVEEANQRMAVLGVRVLGAVLNGTAQRKYGYGTSYASPLTA